MSGFKVCVFLQRKHAKDIVVFMNWFAIVPSLLFIPPVGIWITELALLWRWVDVTAILSSQYNRPIVV